MQRPLNRCQLAGTLMQSGREVVESQQVVKFDFLFGDKSVACVVEKSWLQRKVLRIPLGTELVLSAEICVDRNGTFYLLAYRVDYPGEFWLRFENKKQSKSTEGNSKGDIPDSMAEAS
jgi:hypothetical protein